MKSVRRNTTAAGGYFKSLQIFPRAGKVLILAASVFALSISPVAFAASNVQGSISGEVIEADGSAAAGADVTVTNLGTGFSRTEQTDGDGNFALSALPVGQYRVVARAAGMEAVREPVSVNIGTGTDVTLVIGESAAELSAITVSGARISPIDIQSTESATILGEQTVDRIPVGRNLASVALLAPGTTQGESDFDGLPSFGGSTVGENVCYINGLNVTNFRNGLGCGTVPFEFYQEFQLKTGGFGAEFGRSTGGVVNAVTKSGTNEFHYGASLYYQPFIEGVSGTSPNVRTPSTGEIIALRDNEDDTYSAWDLSLYASGPIVEDKAFFYVLYNPRNTAEEDYEMPSQYYDETTSDDAFWGTKLDWYLAQDHLLELTAFSDARTSTTDEYEYVDGTTGDFIGRLEEEAGGMNYVVKYTGYLTPDFTLSASYGINEYSLSTFSLEEPLVYTYHNGSLEFLNNPLGGGPYGLDEDKRAAYRIDAEWFLGDHTLRIGADYETRDSETDVSYTGTEPYTSPNAGLFGGPGLTFSHGDIYSVNNYICNVLDTDENSADYCPEPNPGYEARVQHYHIAGGFQTLTNAIYIEDKWQVTDALVLSLGLRNEEFNNMDRTGNSFIEITNQVAPRLGFAWDAMGDGTLKVYGNFGRYYLPIANNTNVRFAGGETFFLDFYTWDGTFEGPYSIPNLGTYLGSNTYADGSVPDVSASIDADLEPMYQDEYILGVMKELDNGWALGVRAIRRDLKSTIEDAVIGITDPSVAPAYALINPGQPVTLCDDAGCTTYTVEETGYTESSRFYNAVEFLFERAWDGVWFLKGSYTWAQSYGNNEGYVKSDNGQDDAGITSNFDYPGFLDYSYGYLPNDRRHSLKVFGAWQFADHWQAGANVLMESGRPYSALGVHPTDANAASYGAESFYLNGVPAPRGSFGRTDFTSSLDLSLKYMTAVGDADLTLGVDVFNVLGSAAARELQEQAEFDVGPDQTGPGAPDPNYLTPTAFQAPRAIRLSAQVDF